MSRASKRSFADFFPTAPSVLQEKERAARGRQKAAAQASSGLNGSSTVTAAAIVSVSTGDGAPGDGRAGARDVETTTDQDDRHSHSGDSGDLLNGVGSASSHNSTHSSVFSNGVTASMPTQNGAGAASSELTPLTNHESSPPGRFLSPHAGKPVSMEQSMEGRYSCTPPSPQRPQDVSPIMTPPPSSQPTRVSARPPPGESKGTKCIYDPDLDPKVLSKEQRKQKPRYKEFNDEGRSAPSDPRLAISGYTSGHLNIKPSSVSKTWKFRLRPAPYTMAPFAFDEHSVGPGPPTAIVITGFDPFTSEAQLRAHFGTYGEIAELDNKTDPLTSTFLGICSIRYRDSRTGRQPVVSGPQAAKRAETDGSMKRIGTRQIKVERDRGGARCKRYVESKVRRNKEQREKEAREDARKHAPPPPPPPTHPALTHHPEPTFSPPINAPKGPAARSQPFPLVGIEQDSILNTIKRKPYCFISAEFVPVMGTTLPHLRKRLKHINPEEVRCDSTGYYIIFEDHKRGEIEAAKCYNMYHRKMLFDYTMAMECQQYGNPNYERSPSPERVLELKRKREEEERIQKENDMDMEAEKQQRALDLDPVKAALEQLRAEAKAKVLGDIKSRITAPALYDFLDPSKHVDKRRKLGIADPPTQTIPPTYLSLHESSSADQLSSRSHASSHLPYGSTVTRLREEGLRHPPPQAMTNAFVDERRQQQRRTRRKMPTSLHQRLQDAYREDEESDDERRTAIARNTEDQESRPASRMSSVPRMTDRDDESQPTPSGRSALDREETPREDESADESTGIVRASLDPQILKKDVEDMLVTDLQNIITSLPPSVKIYKRAKAELVARRKAKEDDRLFRDKSEEFADLQISTPIDVPLEDVEMSDVVESTEPHAAVSRSKKKAKATKKKSKKQLFEEREAAKAKSKLLLQEKLLQEQEIIESEVPTVVDIDIDAVEEKEEEEEEPRDEVEWGASTEAPRRTVEDDADVFFDVEGWQHLVKDEEDLSFLKEALKDQPLAKIHDVNRWAFDQKQIKTLNGGVINVEGYFVPNPSGAARTEGVKRILESEKSKYLPHRIKVAKAREKREAEADKNRVNPTVAAAAARQAKLASTATSRSNRVSNRTQFKDINTAKQHLTADGQQSDAIRFNQLKKRKKLVKFDRSAIHGWGLYAEENIAMSDMIIEYVGEKVRQAVADIREMRYDKQGMGSSYLFRIDEDTVIDATKKGGIARFINHSCAPNCTAKIIRVDDELRIGIYSKTEIRKGDELTYDYKFDREADDNMRVPCLCGSDVCKGFLN